MKRQIVTVPRDVLRLTAVTWGIDWRGQGLGSTAGGISTTVFNRFPRWVGAPPLQLDRDSLRAWLAIRDQAQGRANVFRLPMSHPLGFDWAGAAGAYAARGVPFDNGQRFSNGYGFAYSPIAIAVGDHAVGATEVTLDTAPTGVGVQVSQILSYDDWPFRVTAVLDVTGSHCRVSIQMPLRAAMPDGAFVDMEGHGRFEAIDDQTGPANYGRGHMSRPVLALQEVLSR